MDITEIDVDELARRLDEGAVLIDVRQPEEYEAARLPQATLVPLAEIPDRLDVVPDDTEVLVICRSGARSGRACEFLTEQGRRALNVSGGMNAWIESGRPFEGSEAASPEG